MAFSRWFRRSKARREASSLYTIIIFRLTDSEITTKTQLDAYTDKIEANLPTSFGKNTFIENIFIQDYDVKDIEAIGMLQGVEQPEGHVQPLGTFEKAWILSGIITRISGNNDDGENAIINRLKLWEDEPKRNNRFPNGRFGIWFGSPRTHTVWPVGFSQSDPTRDQVGLVLRQASFKFHPMVPPANDFLISFVRSRSAGEDEEVDS